MSLCRQACKSDQNMQVLKKSLIKTPRSLDFSQVITHNTNFLHQGFMVRGMSGLPQFFIENIFSQKSKGME